MIHEAHRDLMPAGWLADMQEKLDRKLRFAREKAAQHDYIPYTTENGDWAPTWIMHWTNGFWAAEMWQMFLMTGDAAYRDAAVRAEEMMAVGLTVPNFKYLNHDSGFMWLIQSGVHHALEGDQESLDRTLFAANQLAGRYNPNGFIRAWNDPDSEGWAIIDCMLNLPLLYWASRQTGDPRYRLIAQRHADMAMERFVRPDGSVNHIVCFDPETGEFLGSRGGQGYDADSSWSRGQSWALYGFALSYMQTGKREYLDTALRVANYFIACCQETDWIPSCDFRAPDRTLLDNAAGAIAACGLLTIARLLPETQRTPYAQAAKKLLLAMTETCCDWSEEQPAILTKCTVAYHSHERHITMTYADYYLIEAVAMLSGQEMNFWAPDMRGMKDE